MAIIRNNIIPYVCVLLIFILCSCSGGNEPIPVKQITEKVPSNFDQVLDAFIFNPQNQQDFSKILISENMNLSDTLTAEFRTLIGLAHIYQGELYEVTSQILNEVQLDLYEGSDEKHIVYHFIDKLLSINIRDIIDQPEIQGINELLNMLPVHIKESERKPIGVIIDANTNLHGKWERLKSILKDANYSNIPPKPQKDGTFVIDNSPILPDVGIWIMPDNSSEGMLEHFIKHLIPEDDNLIGRAEQTVQKLIDDNMNRFIKKHKLKAEVHTWLAWQEQPGIPMGLAIKKEYLDTNKELANKFVNWLNKLFGFSEE